MLPTIVAASFTLSKPDSVEERNFYKEGRGEREKKGVSEREVRKIHR